MKNLSAMLWSLFASFCLATLLAEAAMLGLFWQRGWFAADRLQRAKEAFYGVNRREIRARLVDNKSVDGSARLEDEVLKRAMRISDMPLRSNVSRRDSIEIGVERNSLRIDQSRYEQTRIGFDRALDADIQKLDGAAIDSVQSLLEQLSPQSAKEHLMLMLTSPGDNDPKRALDDVVVIMGRLSPDRRRKIFSEFQSPEESAQVEAMLRRIREVEAKPPASTTAPAAAPPPATGGAPP